MTDNASVTLTFTGEPGVYDIYRSNRDTHELITTVTIPGVQRD